MKRPGLLKMFAGVTLAMAALSAAAQDYPSRPIRLVVPFAPGGASDLIARIVSVKMGETLRQPVVVDNKSGGGGTIGAMEVIKSPPDGYTLSLSTVSTLAANPAINPSLPYDPITDFTPVINMAATPMVLAVNPAFPARDYKSFVMEIRKSPGKYNYATPGAGGISHLQTELLKSLTGMYFTHIPYRGSGPALNDTVAGVTQIMFDPAPSVLPFLKTGRLVPLAVAAPRRLGDLPNVPTFDEIGLPQVNRMASYGILGPKGMPNAIVIKLADAVKTALADPAVKSRIEATGAVLIGNTPGEFAAQIRAELDVYRQVVARQKLTLQ